MEQKFSFPIVKFIFEAILHPLPFFIKEFPMMDGISQNTKMVEKLSHMFKTLIFYCHCHNALVHCTNQCNFVSLNIFLVSPWLVKDVSDTLCSLAYFSILRVDLPCSFLLLCEIRFIQFLSLYMVINDHIYNLQNY